MPVRCLSLSKRMHYARLSNGQPERFKNSTQEAFGACLGREIHHGWVYLQPRRRGVTAVAMSPVTQSPDPEASGVGIVPDCTPAGPSSVIGAINGAPCPPVAGLSMTVVVNSASESPESDQSASRHKMRLRGIAIQLCNFSQHCKQPKPDKVSL